MVVCLVVMLLVLICLRSTAFAYEGRREQSVLLNGLWEFASGEGDEHAEAPEGQTTLEWQEVALPGRDRASHDHGDEIFADLSPLRGEEVLFPDQ